MIGVANLFFYFEVVFFVMNFHGCLNSYVQGEKKYSWFLLCFHLNIRNDLINFVELGPIIISLI